MAGVPKGLAGAAVLGVGLGFLASQMLFLQWATLIPWAVAGLVVGGVSVDRRQALAIGASYGFALGFSFIAFDYRGADPVLTRVPFFAIIGAVSSCFGAALSLGGEWVGARLRTRPGGTAG